MIVPYGGKLVDCLVSEEKFRTLVGTVDGPHITLNDEDLINLCNLSSGCYSPLTGFMKEAEYISVTRYLRLPQGEDWTIPVLLHAPGFQADDLKPYRNLVLRDNSGKSVAVLDVESVFNIDKSVYCESTYRTNSIAHPGVQNLRRKSSLCVGGTVRVCVNSIKEHRYLMSPVETRSMFGQRNGESAVAFSTRNICHIGHEHLHQIAISQFDQLGICVITGAKVKGSFLPDVVFDAYEYMVEKVYSKDRVFLLNLRLPPIFGGPNEAYLQATVLQNLGFTHFIVGRDHAGIGNFYPKYGSQQVFEDLTGLAIKILAIPEPRYSKDTGKVTTIESELEGKEYVSLNGRDVRRYLLERRYDQLSLIIRPELQQMLTKKLEDKLEPEMEGNTLRRPPQMFFE